MLRLNTIFEAEGLDPGQIQLIRHKEDRLQKLGKSVFEFWHSHREAFEDGYQNVQARRRAFDVGGMVASFIVTNTNETVFIGLYETISRRPAQEGERLPFLNLLLSAEDLVHEMRRRNNMQEYSERLVIEPWKDAINFVKRAATANPRVFRLPVRELPEIFTSWQERLSEAKGIYLLTFNDGQLYVGSASGKKGFWQRWSDYVRTGDGGNRILVQEHRDARDAMVSILEITGSALSTQEIIEREMIWQTKLRAKRLGDE